MVPAVHMVGFDQQVVRKAAPASLPTTFVQSDNSPSCAPAGNKTENFSPTTGEPTLLLMKPHSKTLPGKGSVGNVVNLAGFCFLDLTEWDPRVPTLAWVGASQSSRQTTAPSPTAA